jgi:hypothetical protein
MHRQHMYFEPQSFIPSIEGTRDDPVAAVLNIPPTSAPHTGTGSCRGIQRLPGQPVFFTALGLAPAVDVTQSAATGIKGCS